MMNYISCLFSSVPSFFYSLMEAACFAQTQCAELLIEYGADVLAEDDEGS